MLEKIIEEKMSELTTVIMETLNNFINSIVAILCIAAVGYILYHCVCFMFLRKEIYVQKVMLGYFALLLFRIMGALMVVRPK